MAAFPKDPLGFYIEQEWCTDLLLALPYFSLIQRALDPTCGSGNTLRAMRRAGIEAIGTDIAPRMVDGKRVVQQDFRQLRKLPAGVQAIIFNPPYGSGVQAREFIEHALSLGPILVAALVETRFLSSGGRYTFFRDHPPTCIAILSTRPSCPPGEMLLAGEIKAKGGKQDYCWLIYANWVKDGRTDTVWLKRPSDRRTGVDLPLLAGLAP